MEYTTEPPDHIEPAETEERKCIKAHALAIAAAWTVNLGRPLTEEEQKMAVGAAMRDVEYSQMLGMTTAQRVAMDWDFAMEAA